MTESKLKYKGYLGSIAYSETDEVFYGKIEGISDLVNYESVTEDGLLGAFEEAVDHYLSFCHEHDKQPEKMPSP